jgi:hypothetical protein
MRGVEVETPGGGEMEAMAPDGKCHGDMERTQVEWHGGQKGWHRGKRMWKVEETGGGKRLVREENTLLEWGDLEEEGQGVWW